MNLPELVVGSGVSHTPRFIFLTHFLLLLVQHADLFSVYGYASVHIYKRGLSALINYLAECNKDYKFDK